MGVLDRFKKAAAEAAASTGNNTKMSGFIPDASGMPLSNSDDFINSYKTDAYDNTKVLTAMRASIKAKNEANREVPEFDDFNSNDGPTFGF